MIDKKKPIHQSPLKKNESISYENKKKDSYAWNVKKKMYK